MLCYVMLCLGNKFELRRRIEIEKKYREREREKGMEGGERGGSW